MTNNSKALFGAGIAIVFFLMFFASEWLTPGEPRTVTVNGVGQSAGKPDVAVISLGLETKDPRASKAVEGNRQKTASVVEALGKLGIEPGDMATQNYNISYDQGRRDDSEEPLYWVNNTLKVTIRDLSLLDQVLDQVMEIGATQVWGLQFVVENTDDLVSEAKSLAVQDAHEKAEFLASQAGMKVGKVISIDDQGGSGISPYRAPRMMSANSSVVVPDEQAITSSVRIVYQLR